MARGGAGQFHFTVTELLVLAASFVVTSCLVFLLGFYVGRETGRPHLPAGARVARIPVGEAPPREVAPPAPSPVAPVSPPLGRKPAAPPQRPAGETAGAAETLPAPEPRAAARGASDEGRGVPYTVQVLATRNLAEAESLAASLKQRGMGAFVAKVDGSAGKWYRVRIGRFDDVRSAQRMADRCRREFGLSQAYVSAFRNEQ